MLSLDNDSESVTNRPLQSSPFVKEKEQREPLAQKTKQNPVQRAGHSQASMVHLPSVLGVSGRSGGDQASL